MDNFHEGIKKMARVLLAVMDTKPVGSFQSEKTTISVVR